MSCRFKQFLLVLIVFTLVFSGCSAAPGVPETTPTTDASAPLTNVAATSASTGLKAPPVQEINGQEFYSIEGALYPTVLGVPKLGKDKVSELYQAGDLQGAAVQITTIGDALYYIRQKRQFADPQEACQIFSYLIGGDYKTVGFIEFSYTNNHYWIIYVEHDGLFYAFDPFSPTDSWIYRHITNFRNADVYTFAEDLQAVLPYKGSKLNDIIVSVSSIDLKEIYYIDGLWYPTVFGAPILGKDKVAELYQAGDLQGAAVQITTIGDALYYIRQTKRFAEPQEACQLFATLIDGDYNSVGFIEYFYSDNYYRLVYVEHEGLFYAFDPFRPAENWIYRQGTNFRNANVNTLVKSLHEEFPYNGKRLISTQVTEYRINPNVEKVYSYIGTTFPEGLGQPVLSDAQIDALIAEQDFAKTAETITTLADAVNYYRRAGIIFHEDNDINPVGNLCYYQSAWQVLKDRQGQCVTMSNLNHYLLSGDYDEIGYVEVNSPGDGHVMTYILEDGKYYLINSVDYTEKQLFDLWENDPTLLWCAEDFQEIADSLVDNMRLGDRELVDRVMLVKSPGDFVFARRGENALYPEGCEGTLYYGYGIEYEKATLDWISQTRIDY